MSNVGSTLNLRKGEGAIWRIAHPPIVAFLPFDTHSFTFFRANFLRCFSTKYIFSGVGMSVPLEHYIVAG